MKNSLKQLLRTPAKTFLFFLLMTAVTLLLAFSASLLSETNQRIEEVESGFTTVARVEQVPALTDITTQWINPCFGLGVEQKDVWDDRISTEDLNFEGANYVNAPEYRPYYITEHPDWEHTVGVDRSVDSWLHIFEFTALEDSDELGGAYVRVERFLLKQHNNAEDMGVLPPQEGEEVFLCQCGGTYHDQEGSIAPLKKGKRYIATVELNCSCNYHTIPNNISGTTANDYWTTNLEYVVFGAPYSSQYDANGNEIKSEHFPYLEDGSQNIYRIEEVTEDFYGEGGRGQDWLLWAKTVNQHQRYFPVMPVTGLQMIPVFQENSAYLSDGREITREEYDNGALVCLVPEDTLQKNGWQIGDKLSLPLLCSLYGPKVKMITIPASGDRGVHLSVNYPFSPIKADGSEYEPFWTAEYEIVGTYGLVQSEMLYTDGEIYPDTILIPKNSVQASDADNIACYNHLDGKTATFQIENGTIDEFDAALRAALPEAENLIITYNDNGYTEIMESLQGTRSSALLLFAVGLLAAVAILLLLLYFFVVKEKKRTAIERSLGMTSYQCRTSLLAGILALTVLASGLGTVGAAVSLELFHRQEQTTVEIEKVEEPVESEGMTETEETAETEETGETAETAVEEEPLSPGEYNPKYSLWAKADSVRQEMTGSVQTPVFVYILVPTALVLLVLVLSLLLINRNLAIEPIYLLSGKME